MAPDEIIQLVRQWHDYRRFIAHCDKDSKLQVVSQIWLSHPEALGPVAVLIDGTILKLMLEPFSAFFEMNTMHNDFQSATIRQVILKVCRRVQSLFGKLERGEQLAVACEMLSVPCLEAYPPHVLFGVNVDMEYPDARVLKLVQKKAACGPQHPVFIIADVFYCEAHGYQNLVLPAFDSYQEMLALREKLVKKLKPTDNERVFLDGHFKSLTLELVANFPENKS